MKLKLMLGGIVGFEILDQDLMRLGQETGSHEISWDLTSPSSSSRVPPLSVYRMLKSERVI